MKEAVRVYEFMRDYDKLRTGRMLKTSFPRAIDLCMLELTPGEVHTLMNWYVWCNSWEKPISFILHYLAYNFEKYVLSITSNLREVNRNKFLDIVR